MSFAEKQLAKFGWKSGDGLGKNRDGIKKSISVVKKNDTKGLGGKLDKWDFAWWDHVFNKSASNIQVNKDESGEVKVEKQTTGDIQLSRMGIISTSRPAGPAQPALLSDANPTSTMSTMKPRDEYDDNEEKPAPVAKSGPSWLFGFVKASASGIAAEESKKTNKEFKSSADSFVAKAGAGYDDLKSSEADEYKDYTIKVSDQELFDACEGRTARKGARGEQPGKIGRVMKEYSVNDGSQASTTNSTLSSKNNSDNETDERKQEKKKKKEKKHKEDKEGKSIKKDKMDKKEKKEKKEKKDKKDKKEMKEKEGKSKSSDSSKSKKEKKNADDKEKSKKRKADDDEPRKHKKSKKSSK
ncbi:G patch domain-containing protein 4 [Entomortierella beljakovae]|nr:G patch domain-containing protein 4 [Entomortierella beljakovae]